MKKLKLMMMTLMMCLISLISFGQVCAKIERKDFIGQKIKFLNDNDNKYGYQNFGETTNAYPYLDYNKFKGRTATFIEKNDDIYTLKMDDDSKLVYFKHYSFSDIPNNIGFYSILDSARINYLGKIFINIENQSCKLLSIDFAEDTLKYSQLHGPYNIFYTTGRDTIMKNVHFSETYGPEKGYTYEHQKSNVFEYTFKTEQQIAFEKEELINKRLEQRKNLCQYGRTDKDDFEGTTTYSNGIYGVSLIKVVSSTSKTYYLSLNTSSTYLSIGSGCTILFTDGTKMVKQIKVDSDYYSDEYQYSVFITLTQTELNMLKTKTIKGFKLYIYDEMIDIEDAKDFQTIVSCLINK